MTSRPLLKGVVPLLPHFDHRKAEGRSSLFLTVSTFLFYLSSSASVLLPSDPRASARALRFINDAEPRADDVIENRSGLGRMLSHHHRAAAPANELTRSICLCGPPLYLWQALHFLSQADRVFAARRFRGFGALCGTHAV